MTRQHAIGFGAGLTIVALPLLFFGLTGRGWLEGAAASANLSAWASIACSMPSVAAGVVRCCQRAIRAIARRRR